MWGYPEFYIPVPGGYGTESHGHLGIPLSSRPSTAAATAAAAHPTHGVKSFFAAPPSLDGS
jgi:hypothetical protein